MNFEIYGIKFFANILKLLDNWGTVFLFMLITVICGYLFYRLNIKYHSSFTEGAHHYFLNIILFGFYVGSLTFISKYVSNLDIIYSSIFTVIFYSVSIFILTIFLIIFRRYKLKQFIIKSADWFNKNLDNILTDKNKKANISWITTACIVGDHKYTDLYLKDINSSLKSERKKAIDIDKFKNINIWKDENMNPKNINLI